MQLRPEIETIVYGQDRKGTECPGCGRYLGALELCTSCRRFTPKRPAIRLLKYGTPVLSVVGLVLVIWMGRSMGIPTVHLSDLGPRTNFAGVVIEGTVAAPPRVYESRYGGEDAAGSLQFLLDDGTGVMRVRAYEDATNELARAGKLPALGDRVKVTAHYQYRSQGDLLLLDGASSLEIRRDEPAETLRLTDVARARESAFPQGKRVRVTGRVSTKDIHLDYGFLKWVVEDPLARRLTVKVSEDLFRLAPGGDDARHWKERLGTEEYRYVTLTGALDYEERSGRWNLVPAVSGEIRKADKKTWEADNGVR